MRFSIFFIVLFLFLSCKEKVSSETPAIDELNITDSVAVNDFREFKVLDSKYINVSELWKPFEKDLSDFTEVTYQKLKPLILEADIPTLQNHIREQNLTYTQLVKFYLYRIRKYDRENKLSLNSVISLNPNVINEAIQKDVEYVLHGRVKHSISGMPILLKDNINTASMVTTVGAVVLQDNRTEDAFVVKQLKNQGALILGKANLSEWAYFFCGDCPSGYSAVGGQTLNPYGRRIFDTGGSSSGSGVAVAANFCIAAVGSETSGSILSPSSQNSVVGLKPTIGLVSRSGIIPISSTLDTAGPMAKNVTDTAILLDALFGLDESDFKSIHAIWEPGFYTDNIKDNGILGKRFGAPKRLLKDSLFVSAIEILRKEGAIVVEIEEPEIKLSNFLRLLNLDMKKDLPKYLSNYGNDSLRVKSVADVMQYNKQDSLQKMPYGQKLFKGIVNDKGTDTFLTKIKDTLHNNGKKYFDIPMKENKLDGFLSINNYHAGFAAVAEYPAITVPMGYTDRGEPKGLTFIGRRLQEKFMLQWAYAYEQASKKRRTPENYN